MLPSRREGRRRLRRGRFTRLSGPRSGRTFQRYLTLNMILLLGIWRRVMMSGGTRRPTSFSPPRRRRFKRLFSGRRPLIFQMKLIPRRIRLIIPVVFIVCLIMVPGNGVIKLIMVSWNLMLVSRGRLRLFRRSRGGRTRPARVAVKFLRLTRLLTKPFVFVLFLNCRRLENWVSRKRTLFRQARPVPWFPLLKTLTRRVRCGKKPLTSRKVIMVASGPRVMVIKLQLKISVVRIMNLKNRVSPSTLNASGCRPLFIRGLTVRPWVTVTKLLLIKNGRWFQRQSRMGQAPRSSRIML